MTPIEAADILRQFNAWRRDFDDKIHQPDSRDIGEAIDAAVEMIERLELAESVLKGFGTTAQEVECWLERYRCLEREAEALRARIEAVEKEANKINGRMVEVKKRLQLIVDEPSNTMSNTKAMREMLRQANLALNALEKSK